MANFFSSSEEENLELISSLWNKYKFYVLGAILIFVLGVIGRVIWTESSLKQQEEVTKAFQSFVLSKDDPEIDSKLIAEKIMDEYPNSLYADLSALHLAKIFIENDLLPEAEKQLRWVLKKSSTNWVDDFNPLENVAITRLVRVLLDQEKAKEALETINSFGANTGTLYELKGDAELEMGQLKDAKLSYTIALELNKSQVLRELLRMKIANIEVNENN